MKRYFDTEEEIREFTDYNLEDFPQDYNNSPIKFTLEPMAVTLLSSPAFQIKATQDAL